MNPNNEFAFPVQGSNIHGMTIRDYFAAKALQNIYAKGKSWTLQSIAQEAYDLADAMLEAREK